MGKTKVFNTSYKKRIFTARNGKVMEKRQALKKGQSTVFTTAKTAKQYSWHSF